ncbi:MAG: hypothetical protein R3321_13440 [Nitrososphaeraceae archaeon]|nr:hypothetical protein [Nitrososphaeraceae archaeon]
MICPWNKCGGQALYVLDSRNVIVSRKQQYTKRYYGCPTCNRRFKSIENLDPNHYKIKEIPKWKKIAIEKGV